MPNPKAPPNTVTHAVGAPAPRSFPLRLVYQCSGGCAKFARRMLDGFWLLQMWPPKFIMEPLSLTTVSASQLS